MAALAPAYRPRRPTETVLYNVVRQHLETFLAHAREEYSAPLPPYVEQELRDYLRCGVFAHGFVRAHCDSCGHDLLVAFSCKGRGVCPSCAGRRMSSTAAHLVDRVLPSVPVRQWVLSLPFELRALAAFRADVLSALSRIFVETIFARYRADGPSAAQCGAVTFVQRFGSSLNLNVHFHVVVLDGVFARDDCGRPVFHPAPPPTSHELDAIVRRVRRRASAWLERNQKGEAALESGEQTPLEACAMIAMKRGTVQPLPDLAGDASAIGAPLESPPPNEGAVEHDGFNLHASVAIAADDDLGRERLCRYGARPPLALDRLRRLPGGRIAYRIKRLRGGRAKHRVMTPLDLLARLAALVPPPRYPLVRFHGVLAPRSSWRRDVVPNPPENVSCKKLPAPTKREAPHAPKPTSEPEATRSRPAPPAETTAPASTAAHVLVAGGPGRATESELLAPNILRVKHWSRLLGGLLYAASPRLDWPTLLRRTFAVDVLSCAKCGGRVRVLSAITDPALVGLVLESLGMPTAPRIARARDPTELLGDENVG